MITDDSLDNFCKCVGFLLEEGWVERSATSLHCRSTHPTLIHATLATLTLRVARYRCYSFSEKGVCQL